MHYIAYYLQNLQLDQFYNLCPHVYRSTLDILDSLMLCARTRLVPLLETLLHNLWRALQATAEPHADCAAYSLCLNLMFTR
jgi:hypothetical protein